MWSLLKYPLTFWTWRLSWNIVKVSQDLFCFWTLKQLYVPVTVSSGTIVASIFHHRQVWLKIFWSAFWMNPSTACRHRAQGFDVCFSHSPTLTTASPHSEASGDGEVKDYSPFSPQRSDTSTPSSLYEPCESNFFCYYKFMHAAIVAHWAHPKRKEFY